MDGVRWREAARITELGANDSAYLLRRADEAMFANKRTARGLRNRA